MAEVRQRRAKGNQRLKTSMKKNKDIDKEKNRGGHFEVYKLDIVRGEKWFKVPWVRDAKGEVCASRRGPCNEYKE